MKNLMLTVSIATLAFFNLCGQDSCLDAIDISPLFDTEIDEIATSQVFDNSTMTAGSDDPSQSDVENCFFDGSLDKTAWFSFKGKDGLFQIFTLFCVATEFDDPQFALYKGDCDNLELVACDDDSGPQLVPRLIVHLEQDVDYILIVDSYLETDGNLSCGAYCIQTQRIADITCDDISVGEFEFSPSPARLCQGDTLTIVNTEPASIPLANNGGGFFWLFTSVPPTNEQDPFANPGVLFDATATSFSQGYQLRNSGGGPFGPQYATPIVYGELYDEQWSSACIAYGEPIKFNILSDAYPPMDIDYNVDLNSMQIQLIISGGSDNYFIEWEDGTQGETFDFTTPGFYQVTVYDEIACLDPEIRNINAMSSSLANLEELGIKLFPNPASNYLTLEIATGQNFSYTIFDALGKRMDTGQWNSNALQLDISHYPDGTYIVNVSGINGVNSLEKFSVCR